MKKIKKWICKKFGHKFNPVLFTMFEIEHFAINRENFKDSTITCDRCGAILKHNFNL
ncbi:hypothetical protein M0R04_10065 [Candidatus Dojkabacteria bacterium]|nr:hypothetical protein [Candidatus Dojkabacteria bacterium]